MNYKNDDLFINRNFANKTQITFNLQNSHNSHQSQDINNMTNDDNELVMILMINHENFNDFKTYNQIMTNSNSNKWQLIMNKKIDDLSSRNTWNLILSFDDANIIDEKWIYKIKLNNDDIVNKYKIKYVTKDFQQTYDIEYEKIFNKTVKSMMFRILFAFVAWNDLKIQQWDIKSTFSNVNLKNKIYMKQSK
jgi:hypothetical protein